MEINEDLVSLMVDNFINRNYGKKITGLNIRNDLVESIMGMFEQNSKSINNIKIEFDDDDGYLD